jgi:hypothetical protein
MRSVLRIAATLATASSTRQVEKHLASVMMDSK